MDADPAAAERPTEPGRRLRWQAVVLAVVVVVGASLTVGGIAVRVIAAREDPFEGAPQLQLGVFDYMMLPTVGRSYRAGNVEVVLLAVARPEGGGWALHFVLHSDRGLDRYRTHLVPSDGARASATCSASGWSGWGECFVAIPAALGPRVELELWEDRRVVGSFHLDLATVGAASAASH